MDSRASRSSELHAGGVVLVEARLQGGAPWGFTLQGGLEHGEPLIISKVEEGGKVSNLQHPLLAGDQLLLINQVELSGSRQEAVSLVKGSHRTLQVTVHRRSELTSRPHSWHSSKLGGSEPDSSQLEEGCPRGPDTQHTPWHHGYHHHQASVSTTDLCVGWDSGFSYLRRSPDLYSSRGSLDSLDPRPPFQSRAEPLDLPLDPPLDSLDHRDHQPTPIHSSTRSSNSMDLLHNKRDSAYSSLSTSSSIPECLASAPSLSSERCYSLESVPQRGREGEGCYSLESVPQRGREGEGGFMRSELTSAASLGNSLSQERGVSQQGGGVCYRGNSSSSGGVQGSKRHSVGPIWAPTAGRSSSDSLKEAPAPPHHSDSYIATHRRPNSWSSLDHARSLRSLHKGSWHHSSGSVTSAKGVYGADVQLHTVVEKSPESSPTTRPRQGGALPQLGPPSGAPHTGPVLLGTYPLPYQGPSQGHPTLGAGDTVHQLWQGLGGEEEVQGWRDGENGHPHWSTSSSSSFCPLRDEVQADRAEDHHQVSARLAQGQVAPARPPHPPSHQTTPPQPQPGPLAPQPWDQAQQEHPLTRLEMALAEVQRCAGPDGVLTSGGSQASSQLSVLEKVSRFERREHGVQQRSFSRHSLQYKNEQSQSSPCGAEDLRNMLERSGTKAHRTMSYRGRSSDHTQHRNPIDPSSVLLRSRSSFHLGDPRPEDLSPPGQPPQHLLFPDHYFSSSYRDSLKDAQSKVLGFTSFRRRDLSSSLQPPPAASLLHHHTSSSPGLPSTTSPHSLEKRGPKTKPKPHRVVLTSSSPPPVTSPHTPRERHTVAPPALPGAPPVGPPLPGRVCGRRRLGVQQKKRSYSEPDSLHEVGVWDPETAALFRRGGGEGSVADRRRMFEVTAHGGNLGGDGPRPQSPRPRPPPLWQAQQDALAQYIQRKRRGRRDPEIPLRPYSAYLPDTDRQTEASSLSSSSSLLSLPESCPDRTRRPGGQSSAPRPSSAGMDPAPPPPVHTGAQHLTPAPGPASPPHGPPLDLGLSRQVHGALQRAGSGRSASAGDLLEERETGDQHHRCLSTTPETTSHHQDVRDVSMTTLSTAEAPQQPDRPINTQTPEGHAPSSDPAHHYQVAGPQAGVGESHPPVTRRERPRISSPLAASVGLPCPSPLPHPVTSPPHPITSSPTLLNTVAGGVTEETMATAGMEDSDGLNHFSLPLPSLPSLRISESSLLSLSQQSEEDLDEVFFPLPPPPPIRASDVMEHSPPTQQEVGGGTGIHGDLPVTMETTASVGPSPHPVPWTIPGEAQDSLGLKYQPLPMREASAQELRVQALRGQLVLRDHSMASLLDTLGSKRTIELMEDVFHGSGLAGNSPWQRGGSSSSRWDDHRVQDVGSPGVVGGRKTNPDDEEKDLDMTKVELCGALRRSVEVLQEEKEVLQEELRQHRALGASLEAVVQARCRPNEWDKYRVFIGDLEKVVNLLLSLSGRLARTEAALYYLEDRQGNYTKERDLEDRQGDYTKERDLEDRQGDYTKERDLEDRQGNYTKERDLEDRQGDYIKERASLLLKLSQLWSQREDARELKENAERRQRGVHSLLSGHMTPAQLHLYRRLVTAKPSLLIRQRHLDDLIRQGEEHLVLIKETLPPHLAGQPDSSRGFQLSSIPAPCPSTPTPPGNAHPARCSAVTSL